MRRNLQLKVKRVIDVAVAEAGIALLSPIFLLIVILIKLDSPGAVFYSQERIGLRGRRFRVLKFRTMVENAERFGAGIHVDRDDPRITRAGCILRRFSLDELPQLWNVLAGDMSLVGPRPALPYQVAHYSEREASRLFMLPGITGWSQVNGRNSLPWTERLEKDAWYIEHFSLWLDARILWRTFKVWLSGEGLYASQKQIFSSSEAEIPISSRRAT